ncbi:uncharacterized protein BX663DRAFT_428413, partial [Cokeromyces recurvatus]|uniref:uncharacterized protein n=1 Tax=Cokeromyces recurvatus TaxID=90255 RepID=UPI00221F1360
PADSQINLVDHALNQLPLPHSSPCPPFWVTLCRILWYFDTLCNPEEDYSTDPEPSQVLLPSLFPWW